MTSGLVTLFLLTFLAFLAAFSVATRTRPEGRAELALTVGILWNAFILVPVYALGLSNVLTRKTLASTSLVFFSVVIAASFTAVPIRDHARAVLRSMYDVVTLPSAGIAVARRARSITVFVLLLALFVFVYSFFLAWYVPSWRAWDALWYHEPMVGFTIQNHGFRVVDLPIGMQKVNGYPRLAEMTQLWFAIFAGRRLIDISNSFVAPLVVLAEYLICLRFSRDRVIAMAAGAVIFLMPAGVSLLQSTYVDLHVAGLELALIYYATRPCMRLRDGILAAVAMTLAVGAKQMAMVPVGIFSIVAMVRLIAQNRTTSALRVAGTLAFASTLIVGMAATIYIRNWVVFKNPFWPDLKFDSETLGIHWPGSYEWGTGKDELGYERIDMNLPVGQFLDDLFSIPYSWKRGHYGEVHDYGFPVAWVVLPLGIPVVLALAFAAIRAPLARILRRPSWQLSDDTKGAVLLAFAVTIMLYTTPAMWASRYNIASSGVLVVLLAWAGSRPGWERFGDGFMGFMAVGAILAFFWTTPRWWLTPSELKYLAGFPYPEREFTPASSISPTLPIWSASPVTRELGLKRELTLGEGAVVVFDELWGNYPALFWNNDYSNRVVFVHGSATFVDDAKAANALWIFCANGDFFCRSLAKPKSGWTDLGFLSVEHHGEIFRRDSW